jgi:hypothetical protein
MRGIQPQLILASRFVHEPEFMSGSSSPMRSVMQSSSGAIEALLAARAAGNEAAPAAASR